jgi:hypothetical protein
MRQPAALLAFGLLLWPASPDAQAPSCNLEAMGTLACIAGKQCSCGYERGGTMTGLPGDFRWDCGVTRPSCPRDPNLGPTSQPYDGPLPRSLELDNSRTIIRRR